MVTYGGVILSGGLVSSFLVLGLIGCQVRKFGDGGKSLTKSENSVVPAHFDVNDVSFLFPLPKSPQELGGLLQVSQISNDGLSLLSEKIFNDVVEKFKAVNLSFETSSKTFQAPHVAIAAQYSFWRITALRFDPCANSKTHSQLKASDLTQQCLFEIRLIAQPVSNVYQTRKDIAGLPPDPTLVRPFRAEDFALHLIYVVPNQQRQQVLTDLTSELRRIQESSQNGTQGKPLGIHPTMAAQGIGSDGTYAKSIRELILKFTGGHTLSGIAMAQGNTEQLHWRFAAVGVDPDTQSVKDLISIPEIPEDVEKVANLQNCCSLSPSLTNPAPNMESFLNVFKEKVDSQILKDKIASAKSVEAQLRTGIQTALDLENPEKFSQFEKNCFSCHLATPLKLMSQKVLEAKWEDFSRFQVPENTTGEPDSSSINAVKWSIRNFGYLGQNPVVSQRTINESAVVANLLTKIANGQ